MPCGRLDISSASHDSAAHKFPLVRMVMCFRIQTIFNTLSRRNWRISRRNVISFNKNRIGAAAHPESDGAHLGSPGIPHYHATIRPRGGKGGVMSGYIFDVLAFSVSALRSFTRQEFGVFRIYLRA